ncbi:MAG: TerB N-terminal domain-containing protein [Sulfurovum sp.]
MNNNQDIGRYSDDLVEFQISTGFKNIVKTKNKMLGVWKKPKESVKIDIYTITKGFFYYGGQLNALNKYGTESSLVDDTLPIKSSFITYQDDSLGYWAKYSELSAKGRGAYLAWLSSERNNPDTPIGYIFIYFYGIERRLLIDFNRGDVSDEECYSLYVEVLRLLNIYGKNNSFYSYANNLIEYFTIIAPHIISIEHSSIGGSYYSLLFRYCLATVVKKGESIPPELALAWVEGYPEYNFRTPARRCQNEFKKLFMGRYMEKFGEGMKVKANKSKFDTHFQPASSSLLGFEAIKLDLPDPSVLIAPLKKLIIIADLCNDELNVYSRYIGKKGTSKNDLFGLILLPNKLFSNLDGNSIFSKIKEWIQKSINEDNGLITVKDFYSKINIPLPQSINKKEAKFISNLAQKINFGIAPNLRYHNIKIKVDGIIVFFNEEDVQYFEPSEIFTQTSIILRLGTMIISATNHITEDEISLLKKIIEQGTELSIIEKKSLNAYLLWLLNTPSTMNGLKAELSNLSMEEKKSISYILINIALLDGIIHPSKSKLIEKLYTVLGLDKSMVMKDIHILSSKRIIPHQNKKKGFLDEEMIKIHEEETKDAQSMLDEIFTDDDEEDNYSIQSDTNLDNNRLDNKHQELYEVLVMKDEWSQEEVHLLCSKYGLMVNVAIETINEWAYKLVDAPIIDEDGNIFIDREIVEEILELKG